MGFIVSCTCYHALESQGCLTMPSILLFFKCTPYSYFFKWKNNCLILVPWFVALRTTSSILIRPCKQYTLLMVLWFNPNSLIIDFAHSIFWVICSHQEEGCRWKSANSQFANLVLTPWIVQSVMIKFVATHHLINLELYPPFHVDWHWCCRCYAQHLNRPRVLLLLLLLHQQVIICTTL